MHTFHVLVEMYCSSLMLSYYDIVIVDAPDDVDAVDVAMNVPDVINVIYALELP